MTHWTGSRDDYERDYAALLAWKDERPHRHDWMLDVQRMMQVCRGCGIEHDYTPRQDARGMPLPRHWNESSSW